MICLQFIMRSCFRGVFIHYSGHTFQLTVTVPSKHATHEHSWPQTRLSDTTCYSSKPSSSIQGFNRICCVEFQFILLCVFCWDLKMWDIDQTANTLHPSKKSNAIFLTVAPCQWSSHPDSHAYKLIIILIVWWWSVSRPGKIPVLITS